MGIEVAEQYGGADGSLFMVALGVEEISKVDPAAAILMDVQNTLVNYPIRSYGSDYIKSTYLPQLTGEKVGAYALSEPSSGSDAFGMHRTYAGDGSFDVTVTVRDGDVFLVPRGYHGPCAAMPGYDMYYLNVLAGPGAARSLAFTDDPAHTWIRPSWSAEARDARVPMTSANGRVR